MSSSRVGALLRPPPRNVLSSPSPRSSPRALLIGLLQPASRPARAPLSSPVSAHPRFPLLARLPSFLFRAPIPPRTPCSASSSPLGCWDPTRERKEEGGEGAVPCPLPLPVPSASPARSASALPLLASGSPLPLCAPPVRHASRDRLVLRLSSLLGLSPRFARRPSRPVRLSLVRSAPASSALAALLALWAAPSVPSLLLRPSAASCLCGVSRGQCRSAPSGVRCGSAVHALVLAPWPRSAPSWCLFAVYRVIAVLRASLSCARVYSGSPLVPA